MTPQRTTSAEGATPPTGGLAVVMSGGGARAAYQIGFLDEITERLPRLQPPILTGVSAGAINAAYLASRPGTFARNVDELADVWQRLRSEDVFDASALKVWRIVAGWGLRLLSGGRVRTAPRRGLIDTSPLRDFLCGVLGTPDGRLPGIAEKIRRGQLRAVALTASSYTSGGTVTFCQGRDVTGWERPLRRSREVELSVDLVMASSALPLFFPAVRLDDGWYGDGGIRLTAPLAPAVHLGAERVLAISTRSPDPETPPPPHGPIPYPPPSQIAGALLNAIFLDQFDGDALRLERVNELLARIPPSEHGTLRPIALQVHRPSQDLGRLANEYEARLPPNLRFLTRGTGTLETPSNDVLSLIMFQHDYVSRLVELGREDAAASMDQIVAFLEQA